MIYAFIYSEECVVFIFYFYLDVDVSFFVVSIY